MLRLCLELSERDRKLWPRPQQHLPIIQEKGSCARKYMWQPLPSLGLSGPVQQCLRSHLRPIVAAVTTPSQTASSTPIVLKVVNMAPSSKDMQSVTKSLRVT